MIPDLKSSFALLAAAALLARPCHAKLADAIHNWAGADESALPAKLSLTGLYDNVASRSRAVTAGIVPFEVNNPLWSDGSAKQRWVTLPPGARITPTDSDAYAFPDKAVLVKNFAIDTVYGDSLTRILIETRFLVVQPEPAGSGKKYFGISYKWRRDQTDAELVSQSMGLDTLHRITLNGKSVGKRWSYPSSAACADCHRGRGVLGFITPQLNRPSKANPSVNQLEALFTAGVLSANISKPALHRWVGLKETGAGATAAAKARSYLASNCSHCHGNKQSVEGADHDFDWFTANKKIADGEIQGGYVGKVTGKEPGYSKIVFAGYPESSYVVFRMLARGDLNFIGFQAMPPIATYQPDSAAVNVMKDWICSMAVPARTCKAPEVQADGTYWDLEVTGLYPHAMRSRSGAGKSWSLRGRVLTVPEGASRDARLRDAGAGAGPRLFDQRGREVALRRLDALHWEVGADLRPGVYFLKAAGAVSKVNSLP